jgi:hypothetical protein
MYIFIISHGFKGTFWMFIIWRYGEIIAGVGMGKAST